MELTLFIVYLIVFSWLLTRSSFIKKTGINKSWIIIIFALKILAGCLNCWMAFKMSDIPDIAIFHNEGLKEYKLLLHHPVEFSLNIFQSGYTDKYGGLFNSYHSFWNDLTSNLIVKFTAFCNLLSFGHLYVNLIFYNYLIFFGIAGFYRVFTDAYPGNKNVLIISTFLLPSVVYFTGIIHKDGFIFAALGTLLYSLYFSFKCNRINFKRLMSIFLSIMFIFLLRNYICLALIPSILAWYISRKLAFHPLLVFTGFYSLCGVLFFNLNSVFPTVKLPETVIQKQFDFVHLPSSSTYIGITELKPTAKSFLQNAPQALSHTMLRPDRADLKLSKLMLPLFLELIFYQFLLCISILFNVKSIFKQMLRSDFFVWSLFFTFSVFLIIGYTVPIIGAIVRYRSIYLPLLLSPAIYLLQPEKIIKKLRIKKK